MTLSLVRALRVGKSARIAFIGSGGKTTAMFQLARLLLKENGISTVIVTATSHLGSWQISFADVHIIAGSPETIEENRHRLKGIVLITGELERERTKPINDQTLNWLHHYGEVHSLPILIEADGSRQKPLKAWANHEPPIPSFTNHVVQVVGMTGIGKPLTEEDLHRPEIFSNISGLNMNDLVSTEAVINVIKSANAGLKNFPEHARRTVLLNQADTPELQASANGFVLPLLLDYDSVVIASLKQETIFAVHEPIAGIILAAGESTRYGAAKQLLDWKGKPFVRAVAITAREAGLSPVIVVTGANSEKVADALTGLDLTVVENVDWKSGQASSIKAGIKTLRSKTDHIVGGAIFLLTDQPQITSSILRALVQSHAEGLHSIVAPMVMDRRANPVLFDSDTFSDLLTLEGDVGGRAIFHKYRAEYLPWHDDRLLLDVDTPEMYQRLISDETL